MLRELYYTRYPLGHSEQEMANIEVQGYVN